jgi:hypothetical protein
MIYCNTRGKNRRGSADLPAQAGSALRHRLHVRMRAPGILIDTSMQNEIRVLRVFCYVLLNRWANNVDLEVVVSGPTEGGFC